MIKSVIFDMDGVLLDSEPIHQRVNLNYFNTLGVSISQDFYDQNFIGLPLEQMLVFLKANNTLQKSVPEMMEECTTLLFDDFATSELEAAEGVEALLQNLQQRGYTLAVGSSSPPELIVLIIEKLGLDLYFQHLVSGYQVEWGKPHPDLFLHIAERLQVAPENCAVIEDSALGLEAAHSAGMKAVGVVNPSANQNMVRASLTVLSFKSSERQAILRVLEDW